VSNDTRISTQWIPLPDSATMASQNHRSGSLPSALLVIRKYPLSVGTYTDVTCSIEVDWVPGMNLCQTMSPGLNDGTEQSSFLEHDDYGLLEQWLGVSQSPQAGKSFAPPEWTHVPLALEWLQWLTPEMAGYGGATTLASVLDRATWSQSLNGFEAALPYTRYNNSALQVVRQINNIVASFVLDGVTRAGWQNNHASALTMMNTTYYVNAYATSKHLPQELPGWHWLPASKSFFGHLRDIIRGSAVFLPNPLYRKSKGAMYRVEVVATGYGLRADGPAAYLAFTIFFTYLLLVIVHVAYTFWRRRVSNAWSSPTDIFLLGQDSPSSGLLQNTCAGAEDYKTLKRQLRIREQANIAAGSEELQLLVDKHTGTQVNENTKYGAKK
jgi:hypothetical protein